MFNTLDGLFSIAIMVGSIVLAARQFRRSTRAQWLRWTLLLPTAAAYLLGLTFLYTISARHLLRHVANGYAERTVDEQLAADPLFVALKKSEPDSYQKIKVHLYEVAAQEGQAADLQRARQYDRDIIAPLASKYLSRGDDVAVAAYLRATAGIRRKVGASNPGLCVADIANNFSQEQTLAIAEMYRRKALDPEARALRLALAALVDSGSGTPVRKVATESETQAFFVAFSTARPDAVPPLQQLDAVIASGSAPAAADASKMCDAHLELLDFLTEQTADKAAPIFRALRQAAVLPGSDASSGGSAVDNG